MNNQESITFPGGVFNIKVYKNKEAQERGEVQKEVTVKNKMTNTSLAVISGLLGNTGSQNPFTYLAVGTAVDPVSASHLSLQAEIADSGLARAAATVSRITTTQTNDTLSLVYLWTVSGPKTIEECGIFNASSAGVMLCRSLTGSISVISGNTIQITYTFKVVGN